MKIQSLSTGAVGYLQVRDKQDGHSLGQSPERESKDSEKQDSHEEKKDPQVTAAELEEAVEAFQSDKVTQANGLRASVVGMGPGIRVVLKDDAGSVIRQLSGEEFIRLRETASSEGRIRGKILDQKH